MRKKKSSSRIREESLHRAKAFIRAFGAESLGHIGKPIPPKVLLKRLGSTFAPRGGGKAKEARLYEVVDFINRYIEFFWLKKLVPEGHYFALKRKKASKKASKKSSKRHLSTGFYLTNNRHNPEIYYLKKHRRRRKKKF